MGTWLRRALLCITVLPCAVSAHAQADLAIAKTSGMPFAVAGGSMTYFLIVSNAGPSNAPGATVTDTFPASITTCTWTCAGSGGGTCTAAGSGNISDTVNLPAGGGVTYTLSCTVSPSVTGTLANTAAVTAPVGISDPNSGNNSSTLSVPLSLEADLTVGVGDGMTTAVPGTSVTYTLVALNPGPSDVSAGTTVTGTLSPLMTCTWTCAGSGGATCPVAAGSGNNINATIAPLPAGSGVTYTLSCAISPAATGNLVNSASLTVPSGVFDPVPENNLRFEGTALWTQADLAITKTDGVTTATPGGPVTYTITASNPGPSNAPGGTIRDIISSWLTCNWTCAGAGGGTCTAAGSGNIVDTVHLPAGSSITYTASCTVSPAATGTLVNTATVTAALTDQNHANNSATDTDTLGTATPIISGTKTVSGSFSVGGVITYLINLINSGFGGQADNPGDEFTDVLPPELALVSATSTSGTALIDVGTNTVTWNGSMPAGGAVSISINATILSAGDDATIENQGSISYDADGNGTNEASGVTDDPGVAGSDNPTSFLLFIGEDFGIPTLDAVGLAMLALLLALCGAWALRRKRRA